MKTTYNGFSGKQRQKAQRWLNRQWNIGVFARPSQCCACGQTEGILHAHAENYGEPFAAGKTDEFPLCYRCHMLTHCRFNNPGAWERYKAAIAQGGRFPPVRKNDFSIIVRDHLGPDLTQCELFEPPHRLFLEEIENYSKCKS